MDTPATLPTTMPAIAPTDSSVVVDSSVVAAVGAAVGAFVGDSVQLQSLSEVQNASCCAWNDSYMAGYRQCVMCGASANIALASIADVKFQSTRS